MNDSEEEANNLVSYNIPAIAEVIGVERFCKSKLKTLYDKLMHSEHIGVKSSIANSFHEVSPNLFNILRSVEFLSSLKHINFFKKVFSVF